MVAEVIPLHQAQVNITWQGANGDLPDPVPYDATDAEIRAWATEAVRAGVPGIVADRRADFSDFVVDRFPANNEVPHNRIFVRPKTPFGRSSLR